MAFFRCDLMSESLGMTTSVLVTMPDTDDLDTAPIIYLLHGLTDNCTGWARYTQAEHLARTHSAILIMPEVQRSFYTDMACGPKYFTYVNQELQAMVRRFFGIQPNPARTYIMGLSMGGYGALKCALTAPQQYAGAAGFSSVADIKAKLPTFSRWHEDQALFSGGVGLRRTICLRWQRVLPMARKKAACQRSFWHAANRTVYLRTICGCEIICGAWTGR